MDNGSLIDEILTAMQDELSSAQLSRLEGILVLKLYPLRIEKKCTDIVVSEDGWETILKRYIAAKRLENCSVNTLIGYSRCIRMLMQSLNKPLTAVKTDDLRYYLVRYQYRNPEKPLSLSYMETLRHYFSSFFGWCLDEGIVQKDPTRRLRKIKVPQVIKKPFTAEERERLKIAAGNLRDIALMEVMYSTACRIGEIVSLNRDQIIYTGRSAEIIVYGEKGKKERKVYLTETATLHLKNYLNSRTDNNPALFVGRKAPHSRLTKGAVEAMLKKLGRQTGIHAHPHKYRRTMLTDMAKRGCELQVLQRYAGHVKPDTTMLYVSVDDAQIKTSFDRYAA